ncbi:MAG: T9SS type A sorting domain-containing protein [Bacteroidales bacterium]|nr:T9SS type A sorting domain-containing protein [Bacteroidales bacterium]
MKKNLVFIICFLISINIFSQEQKTHGRYANRTFETIRLFPDVHYSTAPALDNNLATIAAGYLVIIPDYNIHSGESNTTNQDLFMDIYMPPEEDNIDIRPAIVCVHGGDFLSGGKENEDMVALCDSFAHLGYVSASIDYRLGLGASVEITGIPPNYVFNVTINEENVTRAEYRALQDVNTAVSFLRANAATYGIDPDKIYLVGSSAGSLAAMHNIYYDKVSEIPDAAKGFDDGADLGGYGVYCQPGYSWTSNALVAYWGAIQSTSLIEDNVTPLLAIHGTADMEVPFAIGKSFNLSIPSAAGYNFTTNFPDTYGSYCIDTALINRGLEHETYFVPGAGHEFYGSNNGDFPVSGPNVYWDTVFAKTVDFVYSQFAIDIDYTYVRKGFTIECSAIVEDYTGEETIEWDFDDGSPVAYGLNTSHTYSMGEEFQIALTVIQPNGATETITKFIIITENNGDFDLAIVPVPDANGVVYVKEDGTGNGSSWENALNGFYLQNALFSTEALQVWVDTGKYYPVAYLNNDNSDERLKSFIIPKGKQIYGGFTGESSPGARVEDNYSTLSGDIGEVISPTTNSYHVVVFDTLDNSNTVFLDRFIICDGNADNILTPPHNYGGGVICVSGATVQNCIIRNNVAEIGGGGICYNEGVFDQCRFENNQTTHKGGALALLFDGTVSNSLLINNYAKDMGGAIYIEGDSGNVINCMVGFNEANYGGGIYFRDANGTISNSSIHDNTAGTSGGGVYIYNGSVAIEACTVTKNSADNSGYGCGMNIYNEAHASLVNSVIWGNEGTPTQIRYSASTNCTVSMSYTSVQDLESEYEGSGNINLSAENDGVTPGENYPMFTNLINADYSLLNGSACINSGNNDDVTQSTDVMDNPRIANGIVDMGAYENQSLFMLVATAGENGIVTPETVIVPNGSNQIITISPDEGYTIDAATYNGTEVLGDIEQYGDNYTYTVNYVTADGSFNVSFTIIQYQLTATAGTGGSLTPSSAIVNYGSNQTFTISPEEGYKIFSAAYNGEDVFDELLEGNEDGVFIFTVNNIQGEGTFNVSFELKNFVLSATTGAGGSVSPESVISDYGSEQVFTISPDEGYEIESVYYNDQDVSDELVQSGNNYLYTISNISETGNLQVTFIPLTGINNIERPKVQIYPNPVTNIVNLQINDSDKPFSISITDITGKVSLNPERLNNHQIDISHLPNGIYLLKFYLNDVLIVEKFIKE